MNEHEKRLNERIKKRKLKTSTFRSRPEETDDTTIKPLGVGEEQNKNDMEDSFLPPLFMTQSTEKKLR